jgi:hypothetical protein
MSESRTTNRGFALSDFKDRYRQKCSLQKSSLATEDCIWLGVDVDFNGNQQTRMHLTQEMVANLLPALRVFAETGELPAATTSGEAP